MLLLSKLNPWSTVRTPRSRGVMGLMLAGTLLGSAYYAKRNWDAEAAYEEEHPKKRKIPSREETTGSLKEKEYDLLIIGGGASGAGVAVDAATRGLSVALIEREDFSSCTSSRSTKLVHGGVRYLENAFKHLDWGQYKLVKEALYERYTYLDVAPHLTNPMPIMIPLYKFVARKLSRSNFNQGGGKYLIIGLGYVLSRRRALEEFPMLKGDNLKGAVVYYDGQTNDSRMNVLLACTASEYGADVINHVEAIGLLKNDDGKLCGATVRDRLGNEEFNIRAKGVVNATGPFSDYLRKMDDPTVPDLIVPSSGVHVILPDYFSPRTMGLLDPKTSDGRVIFLLPWEGNTIAGTTDTPVEVSTRPRPLEQEIEFIMKEVKSYLSTDISVQRSDVLSSWSGIRPLVKDLNSADTKKLSRTHVVEVSKSNLLTIAGGKWTIYRKMAEELVDKAIEVLGLQSKASSCLTEKVKIVGGESYTETLFIQLVQQYGLDTEIARHLVKSYGDRAFTVAALEQKYLNKRQKRSDDGRLDANKISPLLPYIEGEIRYACRYEFACKLVDVMAHRTRIAFLNSREAFLVLPSIANVMAEEMKWDETRKNQEIEEARNFLDIMGLAVNTAPTWTRYKELFTQIDTSHDGIVSRAELTAAFKASGLCNSGKDIEKMVENVMGKEAEFISFSEFMDFLQVLENRKMFDCMMTVNNIDRSGGGL